MSRAEKAPRGRRVDDPEEEIGRARQRAEAGVGEGLNVGAVDVAAEHGRPQISASQRRISSSLISGFSNPLRMRVLRARSRVVRPG